MKAPYKEEASNHYVVEVAESTIVDREGRAVGHFDLGYWYLGLLRTEDFMQHPPFGSFFLILEEKEGFWERIGTRFGTWIWRIVGRRREWIWHGGYVGGSGGCLGLVEWRKAMY
jgi:hypothetical protein